MAAPAASLQRVSLVFPVALLCALATPSPASAASPQWVVSANEGKIDLSSGSRQVSFQAPPDTVSFLDFSALPPRVIHVTNISNTVLGPPSNVAISPDGRFALIADSVRLDAASTNSYAPARRIHVVDLQSNPPRVIGAAQAGDQVSGISIARDGRRVLAANRAAGSVSLLVLEPTGSLRQVSELRFAQPADEVSDVAIAPDGRHAYASVRERGHLRELLLDGDSLTLGPRKFSTYGRPYRVLVTPDSRLLLTAGEGAGNGGDRDALTVIDLGAKPARSVHYVPMATGPETLELSPDGRWLVAVLMNGSNLAANDPWRTEHGQVALLERDGNSFRLRQMLDVGRIPEGAVFTPDGRHVVVQCHPERRLWVLDLRHGKLVDSGSRIDVPGMPSGLAAGPSHPARR